MRDGERYTCEQYPALWKQRQTEADIMVTEKCHVTHILHQLVNDDRTNRDWVYIMYM